MPLNPIEELGREIAAEHDNQLVDVPEINALIIPLHIKTDIEVEAEMRLTLIDLFEQGRYTDIEWLAGIRNNS